MGRPCKFCKGTQFVAKNNICVLCAKDRASSSTATVIEDGSNTLRRPGKQVKKEATSSPSQKLSAQGYISDDEDVESDDLHRPSNALLQAIEHEGHGLGQGSLPEYKSVEPVDQLSPPETDYRLILRNCLSGAQNERVNTLVQKVKPETSVFVAVLKNCDVQSPFPRLIISKECALVEAAHFPHENGMTVRLQIPEKSKKWQPKFLMEKGEGMLVGDWLGFINDNHVQVGDVCIFVPSKGSESNMFTVHILCAKATHPSDVTKIRSRHDTKDATMDSAVNTVGPSHGGNVSPESKIHNFSHGSLDGKDTDRDRCSEHPPFILPRRTSLTDTQRKIVDERRKAIGSKYPLYVATLNASNLQRKRIEFCRDYADGVCLPAKNMDVILKSMGNDWKTEMLRRKEKESHRWMLASSGWGDFMRGNEVREGGLVDGDVALFELKSMNEKEITWEVHVVPKENF